MQVQLGVLVPEEIAVALSSRVTETLQASSAPPALERRGLFGRARPAPAPAVPREEEVLAVPAGQLHVPVAAFGNLPTGEVLRLGDVLEESVAAARAADLCIAGLAPEEPDAAAVALDGDVDGLTSVARSVSGTVEGLGLFIDRRRFRPAVVVARARLVGGVGAAGELSRLRAAMGSYRSAPWTMDHLSLLRLEHDNGVDRLVEVRRLPLGPPR
ncbi:MAG: 2'-5' RNA ligase family protein [Marmoricola sp.]